MSARPIVVLLTDFGLSDWFVGAMKGAVLARCPECAVVDLCHTIEPGAVAQAGWLLQKTFRDFPRGAVFCAVVDPGVGTERRAIAAAGEGCFFIAPDNGLLTGIKHLAADWKCRAITNRDWTDPDRSKTFHGRDVFAPAAAEVARLGGIEKAGEPVGAIVETDLPAAAVAPDGTMAGTIVWFDRFGNAVTTIEREAAEKTLGTATGDWLVEIENLTIRSVASTYADVAPGEALAYWGSLGTLEIGVRNGNARERLGLELNRPVRLRKGRTE